jgi:hypothetical protein
MVKPVEKAINCNTGSEMEERLEEWSTVLEKKGESRDEHRANYFTSPKLLSVRSILLVASHTHVGLPRALST